MKYMIVSSADLERITLFTSEDTGDAAAAIEQVPSDTYLPARVVVIPCDTAETMVVVDEGDPIPSVVRRGPPVKPAPAPAADPNALHPPYQPFTVDQLQTEVLRRGITMPEAGSGASGAYIKQDYIDALVAFDT